MTSSSKKKKKKRADFQKVKFKVGRKLPKGQNVTNTAFQTRKIKLQSHCNFSNEAKSDPRIQLEGIYRNLGVPSVPTRKKAIVGLKDLLTKHKELIKPNIATLINKIAKLIQDDESFVRKEAQIVLKIILSSVNDLEIKPVFPSLSAFLACGMSHINPSIQKDSLFFLDVILDHHPDQLMSANPKMLSNFLEQISSQSRSSSSTNTSRTLLVNPDRSVASTVWRLTVLKRVEKFLRAVLSNFVKSRTGGNVCVADTVWDSNGCYHKVPHIDDILAPQKLPFGRFRLMSATTKTQDRNIIQDRNEMQTFVSTLFPLLVETWVEIRPDVKQRTSNCLPTDSLEMLLCIIEIVKLLLDCIDCHEKEENRLFLNIWFKTTFENKFLDCFMQYFPYSYTNKSLNEVKKKKKKVATTQILPKVQCCNLNLIMCDIFINLNPNMTDKTQKYSKNIITYMMSVFQNAQFNLLSLNNNTITKILKTALGNPAFIGMGEQLLEVIVLHYNDEKNSVSRKSFLTVLLSKVVMDLLDMNIKSSSITNWLISLPKEMLKMEMPTEIIGLVHKIIPYNEDLCGSFQLELTKIIEVILQPEFKKIHRPLIEIMFHLKNLGKRDYELMAHYVLNDDNLLETRLYCIRVLSYRYKRYERLLSINEASYFISFLFSIVLRFNSKELENSSSLESKFPYSVLVVNLNQNHLWPLQKQIIHEVCMGIFGFENYHQMDAVLCSFIHNFLETNSQVSSLSALSIMSLLTELSFITSAVSRIPDDIAKLCLGTMYMELSNERDGYVLGLCRKHLSVCEKIFHFIGDVISGIHLESHANTLCVILSKLLQSYSGLSQKQIAMFSYILDTMKSKFGESLTNSIEWTSLEYEISLKSE